MIRRTWGADKWMLIPQVEHARIAGVIAAAWNFRKARPGGAIMSAIANHDHGWAEVDARPTLNHDGAPRSFLEMPPKESFSIWTRSIAHLAEMKNYSGARLVAAHFIYLAENEINMARLSPREAIALGQFLAEHKKLMEQWKELETEHQSAGLSLNDLSKTNTHSDVTPLPAVPTGTFAEDLRLLQVCDQISLLLCTDFTGSATIADIPYLDDCDSITVTRPNGKFGLTLTPFPLRKNLRDHISAYVIPRKPYASDEELQQVVASTAPITQEFLLSPA
ncbi:MAG: DUF3891 family protein [Candidatus Hydrogenedentota bacterium]|nr:MAG: DUF3891 family protein [Candidatus Hydrogenedentota bacterium]